MRAALAAALLAILAGGVRAQPAAPAGWVGWEAVTLPFRSARFQYFQQGTPQEGGRVARQGTLRAFLRALPGRGVPTPFVILLHGCAGVSELTARALREWAGFLEGEGAGALVLDSFGPRGATSSCGDPDGHWSQRRVDDVFSAAAFLVAAQRADPRRIMVLGQSNGGRTALNTASASEVNRPTQLAGAVALYPYCGDDLRTGFARPLLVIAAARDGFNPPALCQRLGRESGATAMPRVVVIADATHAFDVEAPSRSFAVTERAAGRFEDRLEFSRAARDQAREEVRRFLRGVVP